MKRLLIVSESEVITNVLAEHLKTEYDVYTCANGNNAITLLQEISPDVLIISLTLSDITGLSVLQQSTYKPPVIIALTNYLSDSILQEAQTTGVGSLIRLPFSINGLISHLNRLLNK